MLDHCRPKFCFRPLFSYTLVKSYMKIRSWDCFLFWYHFLKIKNLQLLEKLEVLFLLLYVTVSIITAVSIQYLIQLLQETDLNWKLKAIFHPLYFICGDWSIQIWISRTNSTSAILLLDQILNWKEPVFQIHFRCILKEWKSHKNSLGDFHCSAWH